MGEREETGEQAGKPRRSERRYVAIAAIVVVVLVVAVVLAISELLPTSHEKTEVVKQAPTPPSTSRAVAAAPPASSARPQALGRDAVAAPPARNTEFDAWVHRISGWLSIPPRAVRSYARATVTLNERMPGCHMSWVTLAGIGKQASDHGRAGGGIQPDGMPAEPIDNVELQDFSGDTVSHPSATGPMQLTPSLWEDYGADATGDGDGDLQNMDDAALATGSALCDHGRDLADGDTWWDAVSEINDAPLFLHRVLATATVYGTVAQGPAPPKPAPLHAVEFAISKIGLPYVWGGNGRVGDSAGGFDCSGLTHAAYAAQGIELRRMADWQFRDAPPVPKGQLPQLGDLVFFGDPATRIHHVGIYIGNHEMIDAPSSGQAVQVHRYHVPGDDYAGAGRVVS